MRRPVHTVTIILLSSSVLMGSMVPPSITHIHADGDRTHSHDSDVVEFCEDQNHDHQHGDVLAHARLHEKHEQKNDSHESKADEEDHHAAHTHFWFLGIDFSVPLRECPGPNAPLTWLDYGIPGITGLHGNSNSVMRVEMVDPLDKELGLWNSLHSIDSEITGTAKSGVHRASHKLLSDNMRGEWFRVLQI